MSVEMIQRARYDSLGRVLWHGGTTAESSLSISFQNPNKSNGPATSGEIFSCKGYEEDTAIATTGIAEKLSQDRLGYEDLQTHVPTVDTFIAD
ncbi:hypothetical protein KEM48_009360 [Puccinia striiformis f. sp. tritici PST-130]|nr:hypothetical protein KEM48_009360 [Puccinia striiformis f. sp. tritici PST-130]